MQNPSRQLSLRVLLQLWLVAALLLPLPLAGVRAQDSNTGRVRGRLVLAPTSKDNNARSAGTSSEGRTPVPDKAVDIIDPRTGRVLHSTLTDDDGRFEFPPLSYGDYRISIFGNNVVPQLVNIFTLDVNEVIIEIDRLPDVGGSQATPLQIVLKIDQTLNDARRKGAYLARTVNEVSLGGASLTRSFDELAFYLPGIAAPPQAISNFAGPGVGAGIGTSGQFSANGLRSRANNFTVDGADNNDEDIGVRRQGFLALVPQPVESLHEYQIITALAPAQVGRNLGAQVNAVSQYGTGEHHGTLYGSGSSHLFNSADFFDATGGNTTMPLTALVGNAPRSVFVDGQQKFVTNGAGRKDRFAFMQGGVTMGGPIRRAQGERELQLFYFVSAEYQRLRSTRETHFAVPTVEERGLSGSGATGLSLNPFTGAPLNAFPTSAQGDAIFSFYPFPNNPEGVYRRNTFTQELPADGLGVIAAGRVDGSKHIFKRLHQLIARYNFTDDYRDLPTVGGALFSTVRPNIRTQTVSLFVNSFLNAPAAPTIISNQLFVSYGRTNINFEERRDNGTLLPTFTDINDPAERSFLINVPFLQNMTRPGSSVVQYQTNRATTAEAQLGTPFEPINAPVGQIAIAGFSPVGMDVFTFPQQRTNNTYQLADTLSILSGQHALAFGTDVRRSELNSRLPRNARPLILFSGGGKAGPLMPDGTRAAIGRFSALDVAATGAANGIYQTLTTGDDSTLGLRYYQYNFFGRDDWRVRPNLSLSYGLRYEYNTPPVEMHRRVEQTFDSPVLTSVRLDPFINGRTQIFSPDRNNFAPRVGLAYAFGKDERSVVRVGAGIYYDQAPGVVVSQSRSVVPTFLTFNTAGFFETREVSPGRFAPVGLGIRLPSTLVTTVNCTPPQFIQIRLPGTLNTIDPRATVPCILDEYLIRQVGGGFVPVLQTVLPVSDLEMPMAYHYTASFERAVAKDTFVSLAYVGTQGRHLLRQTTPNLGDHSPTALHSVYITDERPRFGGFIDQPSQRDAAGVQRARTSPIAGTVRLYETSGNSRYDALQLQVRGPLARAAAYQFNYTLSKVTDDVSDVFDLAGAPSLPQNSLTRAGERSVANFDARHILSGYFSYTFPQGGDSPSRLKDFLFGGWQVTSKTRFQTAQPFTVNTVKDINKDGNLTDRPNTRSGIVSTGDREQPLQLTVDPNTILAAPGFDGALGRNTFRASNRFELDLSLLKRFTFDDAARRLTFRLDVFNLTNRANFGIPIRYLEAAGFGRAVNTVTPARRLQFSLKFQF